MLPFNWAEITSLVVVVDGHPLLLDDGGGEASAVAAFWLVGVTAAATAEVVETETSGVTEIEGLTKVVDGLPAAGGAAPSAKVPFSAQCVKPVADLLVAFVRAHVCVSTWGDDRGCKGDLSCGWPLTYLCID